ncbi:MAG: ABC transporter permease [Nostoc indistinguendum CM1-VF10]|jgi:ABC-2 type transport system permease protein|nr:ABC transporter permease [Nostoc indistinguendum CM1-VF10]
MKRIFAQCTKELVQFRRDRLTLALAFLLPFLTLLIFGFAIRLESKNIPLIVQDFDRTNISSSYIERLYATNQFLPKQWAADYSVQEAIDKGIAKVAVIIPAEFSQNIQAHRNTIVQVLIDATDVNNARVIKNSIQAVTIFFSQEQGLVPTTGSITPRIRLWFNPGREERLYVVPGVYAVVLWIFPSLLTAIAMVREKEKGTILQVYTSSITASELLLGKALAYLIVAAVEALVIIGLGTLIFQVYLISNPIPLLIGTFLFIADSVLFGLLLGVRSSNQNAAVQGVALIGFITSLLLSGFIYPLNNIPFPLSFVSLLVPTRYFINITRSVFVRGTDWTDIWLDLLILFIFALLLFNISRKALNLMQLPN